jgi:hypothetical protein
MSWLSIRKGRTAPETWRSFKPRIFKAGFKCSVYFPEVSQNISGTHRLFGTQFISGDQICINWTPCLEPGKIALHLSTKVCGIRYSYSLISVAIKRPFTAEVKVSKDNRICVSIDSFEGVLKYITTQESLNKTLVSFDLLPKLESASMDDFNNFVIPS